MSEGESCGSRAPARLVRVVLCCHRLQPSRETRLLQILLLSVAEEVSQQTLQGAGLAIRLVVGQLNNERTYQAKPFLRAYLLLSVLLNAASVGGCGKHGVK